jgi:hypothetical protein
MDGRRFDDLSRALAARHGRRSLLRGAAGALAALAGARRLGAQGACEPPCADGLFCCALGGSGTCLPHEQCCGDFVPCPGGACCGETCLPAGTPCCEGHSPCPAPGECCGELCVAAGPCCDGVVCPGGGCATPCPDGEVCCGAPETGTCVPVGQCCADFLPCLDGTCCNVSCLPAGSQCCAGHVTCPTPGVCCGAQGDFCCVPPNACVDGSCVGPTSTPTATPTETPTATATSIPEADQVTICHAVGNGAFKQIALSAAGVVHGHLGAAHGGHSASGADIIPPFVYHGVTYQQNWDATGQAIFTNGCVNTAADTASAAPAHGAKGRHNHGSG